MTRRRDDVAVLVEESGRVWVNDVLCAEHPFGVGRRREGRPVPGAAPMTGWTRARLLESVR